MGINECNAVRCAEPPPTELPATATVGAMACAEVLAVLPHGVALQGDDGVVMARCAASCLLQPQPGDTVATLCAAGQWYVVAVLQRTTASPATLRLPDTVALVAARQLTVQAPAITQEADTLHLKAGRLRLVHDVLESMGRCWHATVSQLRLVGTQWSSVFDRVDHHAQQQVRTVTGLDQLRVGTLDCQAEQLMRLQAEHLLANGERLVKVRGTQVHLG